MNKKEIAGIKAAEFIEDNMVVGLGTGTTAFYLIHEVEKLIKQGYNLKCIPTSKSTEELAKQLSIPLLSIDDVTSIDLAIDGVDEIDSNFNAIKGGGGALFREKVVATLAKRVIWIMDDSKLVDHIGSFPLPVEVLPYGYKQVIRKLQDYAFNPILRKKDDKIFITDNGNFIIDLHLNKPINIDDVKNKLINIVGILEIGLFLNMCERIVIGTDNGVKVIENKNII